MDSRLLRRAVFLAFSMLVLMLCVVAVLNPEQTAELVNRIAGEEVISVVGTEASEDQQETSSVQNGFVQDVLDENGMIIGSDLSAFLYDETFFDPQKPGYAAMIENETKSLSLMATSVEKDLRVQVVDGLGRKVKGQSFYVTLERADGSPVEPQDDGYKDLDQDGIIYIGGLKAGDYTLRLQEIQGYEVANASLPVTVKDKLEYRIIDDISAFIKTEDEIDVSKEDTEVNEAGKDLDGTEETALKETDGRMRTGIDVSKWNGDIDWERVKNAGVEFAIIRCGYRGSSSGVLVEDPYFVKNIEKARANGISVGVYFFTQAVNEVEAVEEASMVVSLCREYELDYPVFIDTEGAGGNGRADGLGVRERTAVCKAFCETIESAGLKSGVYASRNWWYNNLTASELSDYVTWLAEYRSEPLYTGKYQIWQYTSNGSVDGIEGRVDLNVSHLGY
ncbi:MAG: hypothetical protein GX234_07200 [Clostridiales bacterium]|nr:hypothetical protein [Clostridiales bacterium]